MKTLTAIFVWLSAFHYLQTKATERHHYVPTPVNGTNLVIDGILNEPAWNLAVWQSNLVQYQPVEGNAPHQQTEYALL